MTGAKDSLAGSSELTPLTDRLTLLLVIRLFMACVVLFTSAILPDVPLDETGVLAARVYVALAIGFELAHRLLVRYTQWRWLIIVNAMLMIDGVFVAAVLAGSGQSRSAFIFLAYVHIVSVTLLVGFRTGLKIAVWHSVLLLSVYYLVLAGWLDDTLSPDQIIDRGLSNELSVASASALWLVAIVTAIFSSLNERELRRRKGELTIIADLSSIIEQTRRPSEILEALVETTTSKLGCERAVAICAHAGSIVVVGASAGLPTLKGESLQSLGGSIAQAASSASPVLIRRINPQTDRELSEVLPDASNVAVIPLIAEGDAIAVLAAEWGNSNKRRVTRPMIDLLSNVAGRVALALSNTFLLAEVQRLASVDGLTGLPNRRTFNQAIEREVARSQRSGVPVSLLMLDIDHFKSVNDNHGHQMGDTVLAESAAGVMSACRNEDLPARYGGEEIVVIMPNCSTEQAYAAAERIRKALSAANNTLKGVHASAGVATYPTNATDVQSLLAAADEALYHSKENGRDRTTVAGHTETLSPIDISSH